MDLSAYSYSDLRELSQQLDSEIKRKHAEDIAKARESIVSIAKSVGMTVEALLKNATPADKTPRAPAKPQYQNPDNPAETWSGLGRAPQWVRRHMDAGGLKEALRISPTK